MGKKQSVFSIAGAKGAEARNKKLSPKRRSAIARKAAVIRWGREKK